MFKILELIMTKYFKAILLVLTSFKWIYSSEH
jgi:hypothetical protein